MITLSDLEKEFLKRIVDLLEQTYNMFLGNLLDKDLNIIDANLDRQRNIVEFRFDQRFFLADDYSAQTEPPIPQQSEPIIYSIISLTQFWFKRVLS